MRKIVSALAVTAVTAAAAASLATVAAPASAGTWFPGNASVARAAAPETAASGAAAIQGRFWIYDGTNFTGNKKSYNTNDRWWANDVWDGTSTTVNNHASSANNLTNQWATMYDVGNSGTGACGGDSVGMSAGLWLLDLGQLGFSNVASCIIFG
jgi:peptidase inhibitor family I36